MTPCHKNSYPNEKAARTAINSRMKGRQKNRRGRPDFLRAYWCTHCRAHHITSQEDRYANA